MTAVILTNLLRRGVEVAQPVQLYLLWYATTDATDWHEVATRRGVDEITRQISTSNEVYRTVSLHKE